MNANQDKAIKIIDLAIAAGISRIKLLQERILLIQAFGDKAVWSEEFYEPGADAKNRILSKDFQAEHDDLQKLTASLQDLRNKYFDQQWDQSMRSFFENLNK